MKLEGIIILYLCLASVRPTNKVRGERDAL